MHAGQLVAGRYRFDKQIGAGAMGVVWRAYDETLRRTVALKRANVTSDRDRRRIRREGILAAGFSHPNVVTVYDVLEVIDVTDSNESAGGVPNSGVPNSGEPTSGDSMAESAGGAESWLVLEYVPSVSLAELISTSPPLPVDRVIRIGAQVAAGLAAVHAHGAMHRDMKPGNVLIATGSTAEADAGSVSAGSVSAGSVSPGSVSPGSVSAGSVLAGSVLAKVTDFGLSRAPWADATATDTGVIGGTPGYVAPEVANGEDPTTASDVFSLGATLYAAVEGISPYGDTTDNPWRVLRRAAAGDISTPSRAGRLLPILTALLKRDPAERPDAATAERMLSALVDSSADDSSTDFPTAAGLPGTAASADTTMDDAAGRRGKYSLRPLVSSRRRIAALAALGILAIFIPAGSTLLPASRPDPKPATAAPVLGDARTVDPCGLTDAAALRRFGKTQLETDYGNFARCDVLITGAGGGEFDMKLELDEPTEPDSGVQAKKIGALTVLSQPKEDDSCDRALVLADRNRVTITAKTGDIGPADLCAIADTAVASAAKILNSGKIPRRATPFPAESLAHRDACTMVDSAALARIPGVDAANPKLDFARWGCGWQSTTQKLYADLDFDRDQPLKGGEGASLTLLSGHRTVVEPDGDGAGSCVVLVTYRTYDDAAGQRAIELVKLTVRGDQTGQQLCAVATDVATGMAAKFPAA